MSKTNNKSGVKIPSVLAYSRSLEPSDAFFSQKDSASHTKTESDLSVVTRQIKTTISNRQKDAIKNDVAKLQAEISKTNIQQTQTVYLDQDCDTLVVKTSLKVLPFSAEASSCNNADFEESVKAVVADYANRTSFKELSQRYATNIANGRWLWRNRFNASKVMITVTCVIEDNTEKEFVFNAKDMSLKDPVANVDGIEELADLIAKSLMGEIFLVAYCRAELLMGYGHQAFPSEEMNTDKDIPKTLYQVKGVSALHAAKVGNAIRTIDTWYCVDEGKVAYPISAEVYGSVSKISVAYRPPTNGTDFYSIFDKWLLTGEMPDIEQQHYVMAILIRGGLLGQSGKE